MKQTIIQSGNRAVVVTARDCGDFTACLYVNARDGILNADITSLRATRKTMAGIRKWAAKHEVVAA